MQTIGPARAAERARTIKNAAHARNYGASELMLATMTGSYPPPHIEMDELERDRLVELHMAELEREAQDFYAMLGRMFP